jgi:hypothetical protein
MRQALAGACLTAILVSSATAQPAPSSASDPPSVQFLPRLDIYAAAKALSGDDPQFMWATRVGANFDFVDYVHGRLLFITDYEGFFGEELQPFDPNQNIYTLAMGLSGRFRGTEIVAMYRHVSRHLIDREKDFGIAWNEVRGLLIRRVPVGDAAVDLTAEVGNVINRSYVDYEWSLLIHARTERQISPRSAFFVRGTGEYWVVDDTKAGRENKSGGLFEAGVRFGGRGGGLELFGGFEQKVDAEPLARETRSWWYAGFRLAP